MSKHGVLTYQGNVEATVGEFVGPDTGQRFFVATDATYDRATDMTTVEFDEYQGQP